MFKAQKIQNVQPRDKFPTFKLSGKRGNYDVNHLQCNR